MPEPRIRVKAMCLITNGDEVLVADGETLQSNPETRTVAQDPFYRVLGGSMNFSETAEQGVRREITEELGVDILNLRPVAVVENIFTYAGEPGHEIVFLFKGATDDRDVLESRRIRVIEEGYEFDAVWIPFDDVLTGRKPLYPAFDYGTILKPEMS